MADLSDVLTVLASTVAAALYPAGTDHASALGVACRVYPGWPSPAALDADIKAGKLNVSIYPRPTERNTTRYSLDDDEISRAPATYTLTAAGQVITVGGASPAPYSPQNLAAIVNGKPYVVTAGAGDSPATLAAALQALIAADLAGTSVAGASVTLPPAARLGALRVATTGTASVEVGRQEREFQITVWANSPARRDAAAKIIDPSLRALSFLAMPDHTAARLLYRSSPVTDFDQKAGIYRRDFIYAVEYATTVQTAVAELVAIETDLSPAPDGINATDTVTIYS